MTVYAKNVKPYNAHRWVGMDKNAIVSFTKKLLIQNPDQLIRHVFYRIRVRRNDSVFSGNY